MDNFNFISHKHYKHYNIKYGKAIQQPNGSYINANNTVTWYNEQDACHRVDGPAVIYSNGSAAWYLDGNVYPFKEYLKLAPITDEQKLLLRLQYG
jgi:hypothetical protein